MKKTLPLLFALVLFSALSAVRANAAVLLDESFNTSDGGFTVTTPVPYDGPWRYDNAAGFWSQDGQASENSHPNTSLLTSPVMSLTAAGNLKLTFVHKYSFEFDGTRWDGGQVRISVNGGPFTAVTSFLQNGYNGSVAANSTSELRGQPAFTATSPGFQPGLASGGLIASIADLGSFNAGDTVRVQFMAASDTNTRGQVPGWAIDSVRVESLTPPSLVCPSNVVAECAGGLTPVSYTATATDASGAPVPVTCTPPSGTGFRIGTSNVICTATSGGLTSTCAFTVTVVDTTPPTLTCPPNITATATSPSGAVVNYTAGAFDACGIRDFNCTPPPGSTFPIGTTTATCQATDPAGNSNSCSFTVAVNSPNRCPIAVATAGPGCELAPGQTATIVISGNNADACLTLDGSASSDADGDPLTYIWLADLDGDGTKEPIGAGATITNCLPPGAHDILLVVDDGRCSATATVTVQIISPCEAVEQLIAAVDAAALDRRNKRPFIASLKAACASFERGNCTSAFNQLHAFQNKVRSQIGRTQPLVADALIALTQHILDCTNCE